MSVRKGSLIPELTGATAAHSLAVVRWVAGLRGRAAVVSDHAQTTAYVELLPQRAHSRPDPPDKSLSCFSSNQAVARTGPHCMARHEGKCSRNGIWPSGDHQTDVSWQSRTILTKTFSFAENIALLAETALRFLELVQLKNLNMENEPTGEEMDETSHPSDNYDTGNVASTYPACLEQQIMGQSFELGLIFLLSQS